MTRSLSGFRLTPRPVDSPLPHLVSSNGTKVQAKASATMGSGPAVLLELPLHQSRSCRLSHGLLDVQRGHGRSACALQNEHQS